MNWDPDTIAHRVLDHRRPLAGDTGQIVVMVPAADFRREQAARLPRAARSASWSATPSWRNATASNATA